MFLGLLIGLALWGLITIIVHDNAMPSSAKQATLQRLPPAVLSSIRMNGLLRLVGMLAFLLGTCGAIGWCLEVFL